MAPPTALTLAGILLTVSMACSAPLGAHPAGGLMRLKESDSGGEWTLGLGESIEVMLPERRTTGYRWTITASGAPVMQLVSDDTHAPARALLGAPSQHSWIFAAARPGTTAIELTYARPFGDEPPARRFTLHVTVAPQ